LPNLLSRFASDLFWLARYLERAEALARLIDISKTYAGTETSGAKWEQVLRICGDLETYRETHTESNANAILAFYLLDDQNPTSVAYALRMARENARGVRHLISTELWSHLNILHNTYSTLTGRNLRLSNVSDICHEIKTACQAGEGIIESTLTRGEPWYFYNLGKQLERADQTTRVLDIGYLSLASGDDDQALLSVQWNALIRSLAGYHLYRSKYPAGEYARDVASFMLYEPEFGRSVACCGEAIAANLRRLKQRLPGVPTTAIDEAEAALAKRLESGPDLPVTATRLHRFLDLLQLDIAGVSQAIAKTYFPPEPEADD
jgi:uncharacterized alpha-E superfamily protein